MNEDRIEGQWKQLRGEVRKQWGKLTDDDLDQIAGERDKLVGKVQERYGKSKDEAHEAVERFYGGRQPSGDLGRDLGNDVGRDARL